jgi:hypothetical protein
LGERQFLLLALLVKTGRSSGSFNPLDLLAHSGCLSLDPRAVSEILGVTLPYDDVLSVRDRMWEIAPSLVRYDHAETTTSLIALVGVDAMASPKAGVTVSGSTLKKPISNFYQTDPISRA